MYLSSIEILSAHTSLSDPYTRAEQNLWVGGYLKIKLLKLGLKVGIDFSVCSVVVVQGKEADVGSPMQVPQSEHK